MPSVLDECCRILGCRPDNAVEYFKHPTERIRVVNALSGQMVRTLYRDRQGFKHTFRMTSITNEGAHIIQAYGQLRRPWNMSVCAYYFARHNIRLRNPKVPCAIERWNFGEKRYYPLELLELVNPIYTDDDNDVVLGNVQLSDENSNGWAANDVTSNDDNKEEQITIAKNINKSYDGENVIVQSLANVSLVEGVGENNNQYEHVLGEKR